MDKYIEDYTKAHKITSQYTKRSLRSNLKRVEKALEKPIEEWKVATFKDDEKVIDALVEDYALNSVLVSLSAIKGWLMFNDAPEKLVEEYKEAINDLVEENRDKAHKQEKTEVEEELGENFEYKNLHNKVREFISDNLEKATGSKLRDLVILGLYGLIPPARIGNYLDMSVRSGRGDRLKNDKNYIVKSKDGDYRFIFNKYKTSKHLGKVVYKIKDQLMEKLLDKYFLLFYPERQESNILRDEPN